MKRRLLLLVIVGLLVGMAFAQQSAPYFPWIPSVRMYIGESTLNPAFDLQDYNSSSWRGLATTANINTNFLGLSTLTTFTGGNGNIVSALVGYDSYNSATGGANAYFMSNNYGTGTAVNLIKYSTYKLKKFKKIGLSVGNSWYVNVFSHAEALDSTGPVLPPSFGNPSALVVSDTTKVSATWVNDSIVDITLLAASNYSPVTVTVIASPNATAPFGTDVDREWIWVYTNLLPNSTFSTANDTTAYGFELAPGRTEFATIGWTTAVADDAGNKGFGNAIFTFADASSGIKGTPFEGNRVTYLQHEWYMARMLFFSPDAGNTHQVSLFNFSNDIVVNGHVDVAGHVLFGAPTSWTWLETPFYSNETGRGYPQFVFKAGGPGSIDVDEIQIINAAPQLIDLTRFETGLKYRYGQWTTGSDTSGWGGQGYPTGNGVTTLPGNVTISNGQILFDLSSASGTNMKGFKWTANNGSPGTIYTPSANIGQDVGMELTISTTIGGFNTLNSVVLIAVYGVPSSGSAGIGSPNTDLVASAEFGRINKGIHFAIGQAFSPFYQFQFGARTDLSGVNQIGISNVDFIRDNDTEDYGDPNLFP